MSQNFTTDVTQWQGVDDEPTTGSQNLVESGGTYDSISKLQVGNLIEEHNIAGTYTELIQRKSSKSILKVVIPTGGVLFVALYSRANVNAVHKTTLINSVQFNAGTYYIPFDYEGYSHIRITVDGSFPDGGSFAIYEYILDSEKENVASKGILYNEYVFAVEGSSHSSNNDIFTCDYKANKPLKVKVERVTAAGSTTTCQVYFKKNGTTVKQVGGVTFGQFTDDIILDEDCNGISVYTDGNTTNGTYKITVKFNGDYETLDNKIQTLDNKIQGHIDEVEDTVIEEQYNASTGDHSSTANKASINVTSGDKIKVRLTKVSGDANITGTSARFYNGSTSGTNNSITLGEWKELTADAEYDSIGFYFNSSAACTVKQEVVLYGKFSDIESSVLDLNAKLQDDESRMYHQIYSINVHNDPHSSTIDQIQKDLKQGYYLTMLITEGTGRINTNVVPSVNFYYNGSQKISQKFEIGVPFKVYISQDVDAFGIYMKPSRYGTFIIDVDYGVNVKENGDKYAELSKNADFKQKFIKLIRRFSDSDGNAGNDQLVLLHFSDIHSSAENLSRIVDFQKRFATYINDVICTGDLVYENMDEEDNGTTRGFSYWDDCGAQKYLIAIGNHDIKKVSTSYANTSLEEVYTKFFAPNIATWGVNYTANKLYYYKDYTSQKVRLIVLDANAAPISGVGNTHFDETQKQWFATVLEDARTNGYHVICASHYNFKFPSVGTRAGNRFDAILPGVTENSWSIDESAATIVDTFIGNGGYFVCWLAGHTHMDQFTVLEGHNKQVVINVAESLKSSGIYGDMERVPGQESQDSYNIVSIDTTGKVFRVLKIGGQWDRLLRHRYSLSWDYQNKKLIHD
jgi:hypothetical protein